MPEYFTTRVAQRALNELYRKYKVLIGWKAVYFPNDRITLINYYDHTFSTDITLALKDWRLSSMSFSIDMSILGGLNPTTLRYEEW